LDLDECKQCSFLEDDGFCIVHGEDAATVLRCENKETFEELEEKLKQNKNNNN